MCKVIEINEPDGEVRKGLLTEAEARRVGIAAHDLARLRAISKAGVRAGSLGITTETSGAASMTLRADQAEAVLAFLMEREGIFLASMGVILEEPPK